MTVIGTLVVGFGEDAATASGAIIAEWDDTKNLDSEGEVKSDWLPGDVAWLLLHHDATATILDVKVTHGSIVSEGEVSLPRSAEMGWAEPGEDQTLQYVAAQLADLIFKWFGNVGTGPDLKDKKVRFSSGQFPCLAEVSYPVLFARYKVQTPMVELAIDEEWPLRIYIYYSIEEEG